MKPPPFSCALSSRDRTKEAGAALVLVLACVAILSVVVLTYLSRSLIEGQISSASAGQTEADVFAHGAIDSVIGNLKQEIAAGSTIYPPAGSDLRDPNSLFTPRTNQTAVPYRMDADAPPNVVKRSAYGIPFYAGAFYDTADWPAPDFAANVSTTNVSYNGRYLSTTNWNLPLLMPKESPTSTNLAPVSTFVPPDWIYLDRTASVVTSWNNDLIPDTIGGSFNTSRVIGRYAYVVYDEGGLLDANAAGYPSSVTSAMMRHKISEACADLTQIGLESSDIDALIQWRNPVNGASATAYTNYVYGPNTNAFLTPATGERLFTSRQQLIAFLTQNVASTPADVARLQNALPYLTHFSRELNAPTWYPQKDASSWGGPASYAYASDCTNSTGTNFLVPYVRSAGSFTNASGLAVEPNQPVVRSRFPLSRLAWLGPSGPNGASAPQIQESFGLAWDGKYAAWEYVGSGSGGSIQSSVETLTQIQSENREPNFFELLKAGILSGSLGMYANPDAVPVSEIDSRYAESDQQLMQIGLGIIDQSGSGSLPTRLEFGASTGASALYGTRNIPYLYSLAFTPYRPAANRNDYNAWLEPIFWNPYQAASASTAPLDIRVRLTQGGVQAGATCNVGTTAVPVYLGAVTAPELTAATNPSLEVDAANGASLAAQVTTPTLLSSLATNSNYTVTTSDPADDIFTEPGITYEGFWLGQTILTPQTNSAGAAAPYYIAIPEFATVKGLPPTFVLEANYGTPAAPNWQEVERMDFGAQSDIWNSDPSAASLQGRRIDFFHFDDPRTGRFGLNFHNFLGYDTAAAATVSANEIAATTQTTFWSPSQNFNDLVRAPLNSHTGSGAMTFNYATAAWSSDSSSFRLADNTSTVAGLATPAYTDSDGAQRQSDGWWSSINANTLPMRGDTTAYRPVLLGRNYQSVGELGYAFRDLPWRSLDFSGTNSADAALLDLFCVNDGYAGSTTAPLVAGRVDLNTRNPAVLAAMLNGAARAELSPGFDIDSTDATSIASSIVNLTTTVPLLNKSEIATRLTPIDPTVQPTATSEPGIDTNIKERREALVRALAESGQVRTWNLMIDVVAQVGYFPPTATSLNQFIVKAQHRYWAHVALDRYSGQVVDIQIEPVTQ